MEVGQGSLTIKFSGPLVKKKKLNSLFCIGGVAD